MWLRCHCSIWMCRQLWTLLPTLLLACWEEEGLGRDGRSDTDFVLPDMGIKMPQHLWRKVVNKASYS